MLTDDFNLQLGGPGIGPKPGQCPMDNTGLCNDPFHPGETLNCSIIRECDNYTGANHFEYALGSQTGNVNVWQFSANGSPQWLGADGNPQQPPNGSIPPSVDIATGKYDMYNTDQLAKIGKVLSPYHITLPTQYNPSAGWVLPAGSINQPATVTIPAYTLPTSKPTKQSEAASGASTPGSNASTATVTKSARTNSLYILAAIIAGIWLVEN